MRYLVVLMVLLSGCAAAPNVAVDIYKCPVLVESPGVDVKEEVISCPAGQAPKRGGCTKAGSGSVAPGKVDTELCK